MRDLWRVRYRCGYPCVSWTLLTVDYCQSLLFVCFFFCARGAITFVMKSVIWSHFTFCLAFSSINLSRWSHFDPGTAFFFFPSMMRWAETKWMTAAIILIDDCMIVTSEPCPHSVHRRVCVWTQRTRAIHIGEGLQSPITFCFHSQVNDSPLFIISKKLDSGGGKAKTYVLRLHAGLNHHFAKSIFNRQRGGKWLFN